MELDIAIIIFVSITIVSLITGKTAIKWRESTILQPKVVKQQLAMQDDLIEDLKQELKTWKAKYSASKTLPRVEVDSAPTDDVGLRALVEENLPAIAQSLPGPIGKLLLSNKEAVINYVQQNPEVIKRFISGKSAQGQPSAESGIPGFDPRLAV